MWDYTGKVLDHFRNPRNVGRLENPDGVGQVGSLACGDALTLMFKLDDQKKIRDITFQTFGCASAIASSSALTEMVKGLTLDEAEKLTNKDIADFLGGLPEQKMHCSVMGREALDAAIYNYRTGKPGNRELEERVVCTCFGVTEPELRRIIRENRLESVEQVTHYSKAGGGCGQCIPEIEKLLAAEKSRMASAPEGDAPASRLTNLQRIQLIQDVISREIRPTLQRDGGDIELIDVEGTRVLIAFRGACAGCQVSELTRRDFIEARLRECVDRDIVVEEVSQ